MLTRLVGLAIVLGLGVLVVTQAGPWLRGERGPSGSGAPLEGEGEAYRCVDLAFAANETLGDTVRQFGQPPVDLDQWSDASWEIERAIDRASDACNCPAEACGTAGEALDEVRGQLAAFDETYQGTAAGISNPARRQERILDLLNEARYQL